MLPPQPVEHEPVNCENINSKLFPAYPFRETLTNRRTEVLLPNSINFKISNERQGRDAYRHYGNNYLFHNVNRQSKQRNSLMLAYPKQNLSKAIRSDFQTLSVLSKANY